MPRQSHKKRLDQRRRAIARANTSMDALCVAANRLHMAAVMELPPEDQEITGEQTRIYHMTVAFRDTVVGLRKLMFCILTQEKLESLAREGENHATTDSKIRP